MSLSPVDVVVQPAHLQGHGLSITSWQVQADSLGSDSLSCHGADTIFIPSCPPFDLLEVFGVPLADSLFGKKVTLACNLLSEQSCDLFMHVKSGLRQEHFLNGRPLQRRDVQGESFYPLHLEKGTNRYVVKVEAVTIETWLEAEVLDSASVVAMYVNGQSNNIVFPWVSPADKRLTLTNAHQNLLESEKVQIEVRDVEGQVLGNIGLQPDTFSYALPGLQEGQSYLCTMTLRGQTVRQAIVCGDCDSVFSQLSRQSQRLGTSHPRRPEIVQLLYRYKFLLDHETRHSDWWWQFKIPPIAYQLEHTLAHLQEEHGPSHNEFNVQFVTYRSELDGGCQRYLLVTPDKIDRSKRYPLVIIVRPQVVNHHRFFTSPQFAHQWTTNIIQSLANRHQFIVMMPEARMYGDEDLTPMAEAEMLLAMEDVRCHYPIDAKRIYLHGICSGGYRALKMAALHPDLFAAVGTYTPTYQQAPANEWEERRSLPNLLQRLRHIPILLFGDPLDRHTPPERYADLIADCRRFGLPLTLQQKKYTELLYNAVVAGEEAFSFFDGKVKTEPETEAVGQYADAPAIVDLYGQPFVYVYDPHNHSKSYHKVVERMRKDYEDYMDSPFPLVSDHDVTEELMQQKNLFLIGEDWHTPLLHHLVEQAKTECPQSDVCLSVYRHSHYRQRLFVLFHFGSRSGRMLLHPWIDGTESKL